MTEFGPARKQEVGVGARQEADALRLALRLAPRPRGRSRTYDDETMISCMQQAVLWGRTLPKRDYERIRKFKAWPSARQIERRFGSWNAALDRAGIDPS